MVPPLQVAPQKSETTYYVGWLPLGGYVKIAGMIDESMDTEQMKQPVKPWEFRAKPAWQRLLIMIGGVLVNFSWPSLSIPWCSLPGAKPTYPSRT